MAFGVMSTPLPPIDKDVRGCAEEGVWEVGRREGTDETERNALLLLPTTWRSQHIQARNCTHAFLAPGAHARTRTHTHTHILCRVLLYEYTSVPSSLRGGSSSGGDVRESPLRPALAAAHLLAHPYRR